MEQRKKQEEVDLLMNDVDAETAALKLSGKRIGRRQILGSREGIRKAMVQLLHCFDTPIDGSMETAFSAVVDEFVERAYDFDPRIGEDDVYQASRNVLIMNSIQMHLGIPITLTPSVFAYSMLYPVTDNYYDDARADRAAKLLAADRLLQRLKGNAVPAHGAVDRRIDDLVAMIEREFDRRKFPDVYESLIAIHRAQMRSIFQSGGAPLTSAELLSISVDKGGASVLADGCLVAGNLCAADASLLFQFGVVLQFIDDLQDLDEDIAAGQRTPAGSAGIEGNLERFTDRLYRFVDVITPPAVWERSTGGDRLRKMIDRSCRYLILEAIACGSGWFSPAYCARAESASPVGFPWLRSVRQRIRKLHRSGGSRISQRIATAGQGIGRAVAV